MACAATSREDEASVAREERVVARRRRSIPEREEKTLNGNFRMCDRAANARATRRVAPAPDSMRAKEECRKGFVEVSRRRRARGSAREACGRRGVGSLHRANGETGSRFQSPLTTFLTKRRGRIIGNAPEVSEIGAD
jgi:hypothetical protein